MRVGGECRLGFRRPTKPTGTPMMAAGLGAPAASISSRRNKAVGALPIATTAPPSRSLHSSSAAAERVLPSSCASAGTRASCKVQMTSFPAGSRARVTPCATISASQRIGAPAASAPRAAPTRSPPKPMCRAASTNPQAWIMRTTMSASSDENPTVRFCPDDGERPLVDGGALAQIGLGLSHGRYRRFARVARRPGGRACPLSCRPAGVRPRRFGRCAQGRLAAPLPPRWRSAGRGRSRRR